MREAEVTAVSNKIFCFILMTNAVQVQRVSVCFLSNIVRWLIEASHLVSSSNLISYAYYCRRFYCSRYCPLCRRGIKTIMLQWTINCFGRSKFFVSNISAVQCSVECIDIQVHNCIESIDFVLYRLDFRFKLYLCLHLQFTHISEFVKNFYWFVFERFQSAESRFSIVYGIEWIIG